MAVSSSPARRASLRTAAPLVRGAGRVSSDACSEREVSGDFERGLLFDAQRARLLTATRQVVCELGAANVTIAQIVERAGVSRRTFYDIFADGEECLLAALREDLQRVQGPVLDAWSSAGDWRKRARRCLTELLRLFDEDQALARLLVVDSLSGSYKMHTERSRVLDAMIDALDAAAKAETAAVTNTRLSAEGAIGGVLGVLHTRVSRQASANLIELTGALMGMLVLPYHGPAAASRELGRAVPHGRRRGAVEHELPLRSDPFKAAGMRLTYRTTRVLSVIAENPGSSNRDVGKLAEITDHGQISRLLSRLERLGMIVNEGTGQSRGEPNSWTLTATGRKLTSNLGLHSNRTQTV